MRTKFSTGTCLNTVVRVSGIVGIKYESDYY
eukprot:SAG31_NODE_2543_length_5534_cov_9.026311_7_plen_31_part_00